MKKLSKLVLIILVLSLCCTVLCGFAVGNKKLQETIENQTEHFAGGSGTESDPYKFPPQSSFKSCRT